MRATIAMRALINHEGPVRHVDLVDAKQEGHVQRTRLQHLTRRQTALARHEADIERTDLRGLGMEDIEAVPVLADGADRLRDLRGERENRGAVGAIERTLADDDHRALGLGKPLLEHLREGFRTGSEIVVRIGEIRSLSDHTDANAALRVALADPRIENGRLDARVGADQ